MIRAAAPAPFFDLASLAKPLVTTPLALRHLDLDADRRKQLDFRERAEPLTVRQMLSHSSGLPPWLPYTGETLVSQLRRGFPVGAHPLLRESRVGVSTYSDLNFRLLAELLVIETGKPFTELARNHGMSLAPWDELPVFLPDGPDAEAWSIAAPEAPLPPRAQNLPHDANARAGMKGHAGYGANPGQFRAAVERWISDGWPSSMTVEQCRTEDGIVWGLGLHRAHAGSGRYGNLLAGMPMGRPGLRIIVAPGDELPPPAPPMGEIMESGQWWMHTGFTGCALFVRPADACCIAILSHRRGPSGELLDAEQLRARRLALLEAGLEG